MPKAAGFPIVLSHMDAVGVEQGREKLTSVIPNLAVLLVAHGASRIVIPVPDSRDRERAESGLVDLPVERRSLVQLTDEKGQLLRRVLEYLEPLRQQAQKWPEDAFVAFASTFLYEVSLGLAHHGGVLSGAASVVRDFVPVIDPSQFRGEARFRLGELFRLICSYEPTVVDQGVFATDRSDMSTANALAIMEAAEFRELVSASGRIGYLKHPLLGLKRLKQRFLALMSKPIAKGAITLASTAADAAGGAGLGAASARALGFATSDGCERFNPPFISLGPTNLSLYRAVLREGMPGATPPDGLIMAFRSRSGYQWLSAGEEEKLAREAAVGIAPRLDKHKEALSALGRLVGQ
jgi:hypothetical protein